MISWLADVKIGIMVYMGMSNEVALCVYIYIYINVPIETKATLVYIQLLYQIYAIFISSKQIAGKGSK